MDKTLWACCPHCRHYFKYMGWGARQACPQCNKRVSRHMDTVKIKTGELPMWHPDWPKTEAELSPVPANTETRIRELENFVKEAKVELEFLMKTMTLKSSCDLTKSGQLVKSADALIDQSEAEINYNAILEAQEDR